MIPWRAGARARLASELVINRGKITAAGTDQLSAISIQLSANVTKPIGRKKAHESQKETASILRFCAALRPCLPSRPLIAEG